MRILFILIFLCSCASPKRGVDYYGQNNNKRMFKSNLHAVQGSKPKKHTAKKHSKPKHR